MTQRAVARLGALALALILVTEFAPVLSHSFAGDDFELLSLAWIGGFSPAALFVPHRGVFLKPVMNAAWALLLPVLGASPAAWHGFGIAIHLLNAALLGSFAARLSSVWPSPAHASSSRAGGQTFAKARLTDPVTGLSTAGLWAVHDRLAEPVSSIASLNHSLTFVLYLLALLAILRALASRASRSARVPASTGSSASIGTSGGSIGTDRAVPDRLIAALLLLFALLAYEVAASLIPAAALLIFMAPRGGGTLGRNDSRSVDRDDPSAGHRGVSGAGPAGPFRLRDRIAYLGPALGLAAGAYFALQAAVRLLPGMTSYYRFSAGLAARNFSEIGLSFLHIGSSWIPPGPPVAAVLAALLTAGFLLIGDRPARFGLAWSLCAFLPIAAIPEFSDRYHYIAFAGLALAAGRAIGLAAGRLLPPSRDHEIAAGSRFILVCLSLLVLTHFVWSMGGAREQTAYYGFKSKLPDLLLREVEGIVEMPEEPAGSIWALVWQDDPTFNARMLMRFEETGMSHRFGPSAHPVFVRPDAILGAVYPLDLLNVAGVRSGAFFRTPDPSLAARAISETRVRIVPLARTFWPAGQREGSANVLAARLQETLLATAEVPLALPAPGEGSPGSLRIAYVERVSRAEAFEAEYGGTEKNAPSRPPSNP